MEKEKQKKLLDYILKKETDKLSKLSEHERDKIMGLLMCSLFHDNDYRDKLEYHEPKKRTSKPIR